MIAASRDLRSPVVLLAPDLASTGASLGYACVNLLGEAPDSLYEGSLTTPPCSEGLLWHVFKTPMTLSLAQLEKYQRAVGLKECTLKPGNNVSASGGGECQRALEHDNAEMPFMRGSLSGFTPVSEAVPVDPHDGAIPVALGWPRRALRAEPDNKGKPENYECKVVRFGFTNRAVQSLNNRTVLVYA